VREIAERLSLGGKAAASLLTRARASFREAIAGIFCSEGGHEAGN
jgi:hypothetical protein